MQWNWDPIHNKIIYKQQHTEIEASKPMTSASIVNKLTIFWELDKQIRQIRSKCNGLGSISSIELWIYISESGDLDFQTTAASKLKCFFLHICSDRWHLLLTLCLMAGCDIYETPFNFFFHSSFEFFFFFILREIVRFCQSFLLK